tara:strand:- start:39 stop:791 length:753 start_codon:yes stop_codon:yes gene_type:complete
MKKLIVSLLSAALVTSAFANTTVTLVGSEDNSANVSVQVKSDSDVYGIQFDLKYDATELSIDDKALSSLVNGIHDVYAKAKSEEGLIRVVMFDVGGKELHSDASSITNIISIPFTLNNSKSVSTLLEFDNLVVAGYNGEDLNASAEDYYVNVDAGLPTTTSLSKNYPNPFNPSTTIEYSVSKTGPVSLVIYDLNGAVVKTLVNEVVARNNYSITWDGRNDSGQMVASGQYFYVMNGPAGFTSSEYMTLLK